MYPQGARVCSRRRDKEMSRPPAFSTVNNHYVLDVDAGWYLLLIGWNETNSHFTLITSTLPNFLNPACTQHPSHPPPLPFLTPPTPHPSHSSPLSFLVSSTVTQLSPPMVRANRSNSSGASSTEWNDGYVPSFNSFCYLMLMNIIPASWLVIMNLSSW